MAIQYVNMNFRLWFLCHKRNDYEKSINPQAIAIQRRFFEALDLAISLGKITGLKGFCDDHQLNRTKYSCIKTVLTSLWMKLIIK